MYSPNRYVSYLTLLLCHTKYFRSIVCIKTVPERLIFAPHTQFSLKDFYHKGLSFTKESPSLKSPITFTQLFISTYFSSQGSVKLCAFQLLNNMFDNDLRFKFVMWNMTTLCKWNIRYDFFLHAQSHSILYVVPYP